MADNKKLFDYSLWDPNKKNLRINKIVETLYQEKIVKIKDLADRLDVTKMTIYRDLKSLQDRSIATVTNGVVYLADTEDDGKEPKKVQDEKNESVYDLPTEMNRHSDEKKRIAQRAVELIDHGDSIYLDSGSTMEYVSRVIPEHKDIVVGCHAFYVLLNIRKKADCGIIFSGGYFHEDTLVFESEETINLINRIRINKAFFTAGGVSHQLGVTCSNPFVLNIKRAVINSSHEKILLIDSSKFDRVKKVYFAELEEFDTVITDQHIPEKYRNIIEELGIKLIIA